jgi:hypothetical protein
MVFIEERSELIGKAPTDEQKKMSRQLTGHSWDNQKGDLL